MYSRRTILPFANSMTHVFFRCHNRQMFFKPKEIKERLLILMATYKERYQIRVVDFIVMDNHAHFVFKIRSAELLGHFMRTVNSQLARAINLYFDRDSQALRERYKSPMIDGQKYLYGTIQYVWMNRYRINKKANPQFDPYCSASWRLRSRYKIIIEPKSKADKINNLLACLLDSYEELGICKKDETKELVRQLLCQGVAKISSLTAKIYANLHTIGDALTVSYRAELISAFRRSTGPPLPAYLTCIFS